jgi:acyl carrier protein phosphodiesterase
MNFLAHCLLSGSDPQVLRGNMMADFLPPGYDLASQAPGVRRGIEWHYRIDRFMDGHPLVAQGRRRLFPVHRHYAAVLLDVLYDHMLAEHWDTFSAVPLREFARWVYAEMEAGQKTLPPRLAERVPYMIRDDWLCSYARPDGMRAALSRVQMRARRSTDISRAWDDFCAQKSLYEAEFWAFFPQILQLRDAHLRAA